MERTERELYNVLLVDDEEDAAQIIRKKMDWEAMGFRVAGYAHNGVEALELAEEEQPDVVLTDIKMPYMDGLTLSRRLKELYPDCRIVIFSGFDEFEYAKEAIELEVEQYLLKPVDPQELKVAFSKLKASLDRQLDERRNIDLLREQYMKSLPLLQESFFTSLIEGRIPDSQVEHYLSNYRIDMNGSYYLAAVLHISGVRRGRDFNDMLRVISVRNLADEWMEGRYSGRTLYYLGEVVLIIWHSVEEALASLTDSLDVFCRMATRAIGYPVTAGIGQICTDPSGIRISYQGASSAVAYRALFGNSRALNIREVEPQETQNPAFELDSITQIIRQIRLGDMAHVEAEIDKTVSRLRAGGSSIQRYQMFIMTLCTHLAELCSANRIDPDDVLGTRQDLIRQIFQSDSPAEMDLWLKHTCRKMRDMYRKCMEDTATSIVGNALRYVEDHYNDSNIGIDTICRELGVSAAYFSTVFKKETGKTFISYLTDYRMERAVELLLTTTDRTYMIAEKTGYAEPNYFSYVFKKRFGMSPTAYRAEKMKE